MAFVTLTPLSLRSPSLARATCAFPTMSTGERVGRRAALQLFALSAVIGAARAVRAESIQDELNELKEDVEAIKYEDEVTEEGPTQGENIITKTAAKKAAPEYVKGQADLKAEKEKEYKEMIKIRQKELDSIKSKFSKGN